MDQIKPVFNFSEDVEDLDYRSIPGEDVVYSTMSRTEKSGEKRRWLYYSRSVVNSGCLTDFDVFARREQDGTWSIETSSFQGAMIMGLKRQAAKVYCEAVCRRLVGFKKASPRDIIKIAPMPLVQARGYSFNKAKYKWIDVALLPSDPGAQEWQQ